MVFKTQAEKKKTRTAGSSQPSERPATKTPAMIQPRDIRLYRGMWTMDSGTFGTNGSDLGGERRREREIIVFFCWAVRQARTIGSMRVGS